MKRSAAPSYSKFTKRPVEFELPSKCPSQSEDNWQRKFIVLYAKQSTRKHKIWTHDGEFICYKHESVLIGEEGEQIGKVLLSDLKISNLYTGKSFTVDEWDLRLEEEVLRDSKTEEVTAVLSKPIVPQDTILLTRKGIRVETSQFKNEPISLDVIQGFMRKKVEYIIFCKPSPIQCRVYNQIPDLRTLELSAQIDLLKKLCNHPVLAYTSIQAPERYAKNGRKTFMNFNSILNALGNLDAQKCQTSDSGKLATLLDMVISFYELDEKIVIVSNHTKTLDLIEGLLSYVGFVISRIDAQTPSFKRPEIVDKFNSSTSPTNILLLSSRVAGFGLNLTSASRLILYDSNWAPSIDLKAMSKKRGQEKKCHVYRLVTAGTIEEKILQLQIMMTGLIVALNPEDADPDVFEIINEEMSLALVEGFECNIHHLIKCRCGGNGTLLSELEGMEPHNDEIMLSLRSEESFLDDSMSRLGGIPGAERDDYVLNSTKSEWDDESFQDYSMNETVLEKSVLEMYEREKRQMRQEKREKMKELKESARTNEETGGASREKKPAIDELFRWRHYSVSIPQAFEYIRNNMGLRRISSEHVSFIMLFEPEETEC